MKKTLPRILPILSILLSGILWGVISLFIRKLSAAGLSARQICFVRLLFAAPVFLLIALIFSPAHLKIRLRDIWIFLGTGVVSVLLFNTFYFYTIIHSEASVAVVLLYTSPIFVMILSALLFKEKVKTEKILALAMTFIGCILVSGVVSDGASVRPIVALVGVMAGLFYALYTIFGTFGLKQYDPMTVTAYTFLFAFLASLPICRVEGVFSLLSAKPSLWIWFVGISLLCTVLPYFFYTWGLKRVEPSRAAILVAVEPLVACLLGIFFYGESHDFPKILGIVYVLGAIVLMNMPKRKYG
ncbi:MAG TPA: EamA family transporter [Clostridiales bacterium]|nr:EamA family transporter [Clostridiales bacterium]HCU55888.1 EamA family transporter [Clostridiales bacterium]